MKSVNMIDLREHAYDIMRFPTSTTASNHFVGGRSTGILTALNLVIIPDPEPVRAPVIHAMYLDLSLSKFA